MDSENSQNHLHNHHLHHQFQQQPPLPLHHHHQHHHHLQNQNHQLQQPHHQNLMMPNNNSYSTPPPVSSTGPHQLMSPQHHHFQQQQQIQQIQGGAQNANSFNDVARFPFNVSVGPVGHVGPMTAANEISDGGSRLGTDQPKKKRGRPRKYSPDGSGIGSELSPNGGDYSGSGGSGGGGGNVASSDPGAKKNRGRPLGSGKKQLDTLGTMGVGFTPHVISVKAGEDMASKITAFAQQGPRTVCILSATGSICNVTLRQAGMSGGNVTYEGRFEILSLAGSFHPSENHSRTGGLTVSLAGSDGRVVGGIVAGMLIAATPIQVIVGSFISDFKKQKAKLPSAAPSSNMLNFSTPATGVASSPSQGASSESSEENHDSPADHGPGPFNNASQPMQNMSMYSPISWPNSSINMPPN